MVTRYTKHTGLFGLFISSLVVACSGPDEAGGAGPGNSGIGGSSSTTGGASSSRTGGASSIPSNTGGSLGTGGAVALGSTSTSTATGGSLSTGGANANLGGVSSTGGSRPTGGSRASGGSSIVPTGGTSSVVGTTETGGSRSTGGATATGGRATTGGSRASSGGGGNTAVGGTPSTGGMSSTGGSSGASTGSDGCSDTLALGVTLSEVAVFQSGKISVMKDGTAQTANTTSGADIVEGRQTLFRAYVTVDAGFQSRQLSARLVINDGGTTYYSKQSIGASSSELTGTNSFAIAVPASDIKSGLDYSIKIVECASGTGTAHSPQFPVSGQANLVTRVTGPIKVTVVPVTSNSITPTLDQSFVLGVKQVLDAMYPTSDAQVTLNDTPITGCTITPTTAADGTAWSGCLDRVRARRTSDKPTSDVYYLGIITPATSLKTYCGTQCIAGISFEATASGASGRASLSIGFLPQALNTIAHELGHAHGLAHSPGCNASSADANFPYIVGGKAYIGWPGWDNRTPNTFLNPATVTDIMAYCTPQWVSDYVYSKWEDRVATLNGSALLIGGAEAGTWRVLNVVENSAQWGQPIEYPEPPSGDPFGATVLDADGQAIQEITVYRTNIAIDSPSATSAASYMIPEPADYWDSIQIGNLVMKFDH